MKRQVCIVSFIYSGNSKRFTLRRGFFLEALKYLNALKPLLALLENVSFATENSKIKYLVKASVKI